MEISEKKNSKGPNIRLRYHFNANIYSFVTGQHYFRRTFNVSAINTQLVFSPLFFFQRWKLRSYRSIGYLITHRKISSPKKFVSEKNSLLKALFHVWNVFWGKIAHSKEKSRAFAWEKCNDLTNHLPFRSWDAHSVISATTNKELQIVMLKWLCRSKMAATAQVQRLDLNWEGRPQNNFPAFDFDRMALSIMDAQGGTRPRGLLADSDSMPGIISRAFKNV